MQTNNQTIVIFPADYADKDALYTALIRLADLPDYCGKNADALNDCLSERSQPIRLVLRGACPEQLTRDVNIICHVVEDLGGEVIR